jgi:triacylglycerol lipase
MIAPDDCRDVVLVHGLWRNASQFDVLRAVLRRRCPGLQVHAVNLLPSDGKAGLDVLAYQLAEYVHRLARPVDLVGFSMGGLVGRYYLQRLGGLENAGRLVTLGTPHHGTYVAGFSRAPAARQMRYGGEWIWGLNADASRLARLRCTSVLSPFDLMVIPTTSARLPAAARGCNVEVPTQMHRGLLTDARSLREVVRALST